MVSFLLGLLCIVESYSPVPSAEGPKADVLGEILKAGRQKRTAIREVTGSKKITPEAAAEKLT